MPTNPTLKKLAAIVGVTVVLFLLDWFYVIYVTAHGFEVKVQEFEAVCGYVDNVEPVE